MLKEGYEFKKRVRVQKNDDLLVRGEDQEGFSENGEQPFA